MSIRTITVSLRGLNKRFSSEFTVSYLDRHTHEEDRGHYGRNAMITTRKMKAIDCM